MRTHKGFVVCGEAGAQTLKRAEFRPTPLIHSLAPPRVQRQTAAVDVPAHSNGPRQSSGLPISKDHDTGCLA